MSKYLLLVYGDCLRGMKNNHALKDARYIGDTIIKSWQLLDVGGMPVVIDAKYPHSRSYVNVEMYEVDEMVISSLDKYFNVPKTYIRELVLTKKGTKGILYYVDMKKTNITGNGKIVNNGDWRSYINFLDNKEKLHEKRKKQRDLEDEKLEEKKLEDQKKKEKEKKEKETQNNGDES